ncbi:MAG: transporter substrate-binding domain-containing protein [Deltaproteobacteria bacterium]|nr:transporter substrate-binding domain-containing protein [Deltaproteobacteria bacterium]
MIRSMNIGKKLFILLLALVILGVGVDIEAKEWKKVRIATEGAYAPWNFVETSGKLAGFEIDLFNDICRRMKVECEWIAQDWDGLIPGLKAGKFDIIVDSIGVTDKRKEVIDFTNYYSFQSSQFATLKSSPLAKSLTENQVVFLDKLTPESQRQLDELKKVLKGKVIGVQTATTQSRFIDEHLKGIVDLKEYKTAEQVDMDLVAGRIDAEMASVTYLKPLLATEKGKDFILVGPNFRGKPFPIGNGAGVRKNEAELLKMLNDAIDEAIKDGTVKALSLQWFKYDLLEVPKQ